MQLLSNKPVHRSIKEPNTSNGVGRADEDDWEGFEGSGSTGERYSQD